MTDRNEEIDRAAGKSETPRFLDRALPIRPDRVEMRQFRYIDHADLDTDDEIELLLKLLYEGPEISNYVFHQDGASLNGRLLALRRFNVIKIDETEANWFGHPNFPGDFVRIRKDPPFDWEREVREKGPMYRRSTIMLTEQERRKREHADLAASVSAAITPEAPRSRWGRIEHHYRSRQALYWAAAVGISLLLALIFGS